MIKLVVGKFGENVLKNLKFPLLKRFIAKNYKFIYLFLITNKKIAARSSWYSIALPANCSRLYRRLYWLLLI